MDLIHWETIVPAACITKGLERMASRANIPDPWHGMPSPAWMRAEFVRRFRSQFQDAAFDALSNESQAVTKAAWDAGGRLAVDAASSGEAHSVHE